MPSSPSEDAPQEALLGEPCHEPRTEGEAGERAPDREDEAQDERSAEAQESAPARIARAAEQDVDHALERTERTLVRADHPQMVMLAIVLRRGSQGQGARVRSAPMRRPSTFESMADVSFELPVTAGGGVWLSASGLRAWRRSEAPRRVRRGGHAARSGSGCGRVRGRRQRRRRGGPRVHHPSLRRRNPGRPPLGPLWSPFGDELGQRSPILSNVVEPLPPRSGCRCGQAVRCVGLVDRSPDHHRCSGARVLRHQLGGRTPQWPQSPASSDWCCGRSWWSCRRGSAGSPCSCVALGGQALIVYVAILYVPGIEATAWTAFLARPGSVRSSGRSSRGPPLPARTTDSSRRWRRRARRRQAGLRTQRSTGSCSCRWTVSRFPVLRWAVQSGAVPNIRSWLASGDYVLRSWTPQLPCTTPASQLGILHGTIDGIPAFRWYDRELGRVLVANRPSDARVIEERASTGAGLLCDDGMSISNLFTGDAPRFRMTMSRIEAQRGSTETRRAFAWFLASPSGFMRSLTRTVAEIVKERWQARRQVQAQARPARAPRMDLRGPPGGHERPVARPQHRPRGGGDAPRDSGASMSTTSTTTRSPTTRACSDRSRSLPWTGSTALWQRSRGWQRTAPRRYRLVACCPTTASRRVRRSPTATG
jgi:hypothetical protein